MCQELCCSDPEMLCKIEVSLLRNALSTVCKPFAISPTHWIQKSTHGDIDVPVLINQLDQEALALAK